MDWQKKYKKVSVPFFVLNFEDTFIVLEHVVLLAPLVVCAFSTYRSNAKHHYT